jgi:hypothetical protein
VRDYLSRYPSEYTLNVVDGKGFWGMVGASQKRGIYITSRHQPCSACTAKLSTIVVIVKRSQCKMYPHLHSASAVVRGRFVDFCCVLRMSLSHASSILLHEPAARLCGKGKVGCGYIHSSHVTRTERNWANITPTRRFYETVAKVETKSISPWIQFQSAIFRRTPEIWTEIFQYLAYSVTLILAVSAACREWRKVARQCPRLWKNVSLRISLHALDCTGL